MARLPNDGPWRALPLTRSDQVVNQHCGIHQRAAVWEAQIGWKDGRLPRTQARRDKPRKLGSDNLRCSKDQSYRSRCRSRPPTVLRRRRSILSAGRARNALCNVRAEMRLEHQAYLQSEIAEHWHVAVSSFVENS